MIAGLLWPGDAAYSRTGVDLRTSNGLVGIGPPSSAPELDASGLELVPELTQARPTSEKQAQAFDDAMQFAIDHPDDIGYPWIDPVTNTVVVSAASAKGSQLLGALKIDETQPVRTRDVAFSYRQLETIKDEITTLAADGVPDTDLLRQTAPDHKGNRVTITVSKASDALFQELVKRYGTEAITVRIASNPGIASPASRQDDYSPFWGGAKVNGALSCSTAFPWTGTGSGNGDGMLTAAHCIPNGGTVSAPSQSMGTVTSGSGENWSETAGTQYYTGQTTSRGDVALVNMSSGRASGTAIYRGPYNSSTYSWVDSMGSGYAKVGDTFITGGVTTGELGGWRVTAVGIDVWYGGGVWARNVVEGTRGDTGINHGDSGGSVFTTTTGGRVVARGIITGMFPLCCFVYFTDIRVAYYGLPGWVKVQP
ncbi:MAG: trypsin-like serine protease [Solirubrobacterales bacterium]